MSTYRISATGALAVLLSVTLQLFAPSVYATGNLGAIWGQVAYPNSLSDDRASDGQGFFCALCHASPDGGGRNPYGSALAPLINSKSTQDQIVAAMRQVEGLNSDGDPGGYTNLAEINAGTQPGWKSGDAVPGTLVGDPLDPTGTAADIAVTPQTLDYGAVVVGASVTGAEITVTNMGGTALSVTGLTLTNTAVFSLGVQVPAVPFSIPAGGSVKVGVVYTPDNEGLDTGALLIDSTDPDEPEVTVALQGTGVLTTEGCLPSVSPTQLVFGQLLIGSTLELPVTLRNNGVGTCDVAVSVPLCVDGEFKLTSPATLAVGPGDSAFITVAYAPINLNADQCRIDVNTQANDLQVPMSGEGVAALPTDLDITKFTVTRTADLSKGGIVTMEVTVKNNGTGAAHGTLTVFGQQGSTQFVHQVVQVSDPLGGGAMKIPLQSYVATTTGEIHWTATLVDGDPDLDQATATTVVQQ